MQSEERRERWEGWIGGAASREEGVLMQSVQGLNTYQLCVDLKGVVGGVCAIPTGGILKDTPTDRDDPGQARTYSRTHKRTHEHTQALTYTD